MEELERLFISSLVKFQLKFCLIVYIEAENVELGSILIVLSYHKLIVFIIIIVETVYIMMFRMFFEFLELYFKHSTSTKKTEILRRIF